VVSPRARRRTDEAGPADITAHGPTFGLRQTKVCGAAASRGV
jgi:hypothetical protein